MGFAPFFHGDGLVMLTFFMADFLRSVISVLCDIFQFQENSLWFECRSLDFSR